MAEDTPTDMETKLAEMKHERCDRDSVLLPLRSLYLLVAPVYAGYSYEPALVLLAPTQPVSLLFAPEQSELCCLLLRA